MPFRVPEGMAESDTAQTLFRNFKELYLIFSRCLAEEAKMSEMRINENRRGRKLQPGEEVFW